MSNVTVQNAIAWGVQGKVCRGVVNSEDESKFDCIVKVIECPDLNYGNKLFNQLMKLSELDHKGVLVPEDVFLSWEESTSSVNVNIVYPDLPDPCSLHELISNHIDPSETPGENIDIPIAQVHKAVGEIISALSFIKSSGFLHLNLKPSNVFIQSGHFMVGDFGLPALLSDIATRTRTTEGILYKFTELEYLYRIVEEPKDLHRYHPPELKSMSGSRMYDSKTDVYGLGLLIYQMLFLKLEVPDDISDWHRNAKDIEDPILRGLFLKCADPEYETRPTIDELG